MEEKLTANNVELATVTEEHGFKILKEEEVKVAVDELSQ
jgi:20S proteasome alpha/beta subunit